MCTLEKRGQVYLLTLTGDGEHRLNPTLLGANRSALAHVRSDFAQDCRRDATFITAAEGKYFSNDLNLVRAQATAADRVPHLSSNALSKVADLISLPVLTKAAMTGHAVGARCGVVLSDDYVPMRRDQGYLYMSELDISHPIGPHFMALVRSKIPSPSTLRDVVLRAAKNTGDKAVEIRIVDLALGGAGETVEAALQLGEELTAREGCVCRDVRSSGSYF